MKLPTVVLVVKQVHQELLNQMILAAQNLKKTMGMIAVTMRVAVIMEKLKMLTKMSTT